MKILATTRKDVCLSPFDFHSIGHLILGYIIFFISYWFCLLFNIQEERIYSIIISLLAAVAWELIENVWLINYKFDRRKDSVENSLVDIVTTFCGSFICFFVSLLDLHLFIILTFTIIIVAVFIMEVCAVRTLNGED